MISAEDQVIGVIQLINCAMESFSDNEMFFLHALCDYAAIAIEKGDAALYLHMFGESFGKQEVGFIVTDKLIKENEPAMKS